VTTPLLLVGDGPHEATGLGRILRDLGRRIHASDLPVELVSMGGPILPAWREWPHVPMPESVRDDDWGADFVEEFWGKWFGDRPGVVWVVWDPGRLAAYHGIGIPVQIWSYPAVDAANRIGSIGGPAGAALAGVDRLVAYGRWASRIVRTTRSVGVPYLPHGLDLATYAPPDVEEEGWAASQLGPHRKRGDLVIGCVATNQPRKDLALYFGALAELAARGYPVYGWLHTDVLVKAWSIVQLVEDCGLARRVTVSTRPYTDRELALLYQACDLTIAPGLGEGFGYPIVESLAAGRPVVHGDFGGGRELIPKKEWRFPVRAIRLEGIYAQQRPVFKAEDVANAIERIFGWRKEVGAATVSAYCRGAVAHLDWARIWPRWYAWIKGGL
jgi:glycosyltransferase involved in cell wall biosynthesis